MKESFTHSIQTLLFPFYQSVPAMTKGRVVYFIRHGEKPVQGNGLNAQGQQRSKYLTEHFGPSSNYGVKYLIAQRPKKDGRQRRAYDTLRPLADDLGLTVDTDCGRDEIDALVAKIQSYAGTGNVLVCWEHKRLSDIAAALGVPHPPRYPTERFDVIWTCEAPFHAIVESKQMCPGLDVNQ